MKNSWHIFINDIKKLSKNWVALIIIGGLVVLPSLYAWFNIEASWDPYGQTGDIPVGIVNEDAGATVRGEDINVGDELVDELKDNKKMNWQFVSHDKAMDKVEYGDYYAMIVIPENFSEKLATVIDGDPHKATVEYYVNEKINAIAPKITQKGASVIVEEISGKFVSTVNGIIFDIFNQLGVELEDNVPDIEKFEDYIFLMEDKLPKIHSKLNSTKSDAKDVDGIIAKAQDKMPEVGDITNKGISTIDQTVTYLNDAEDKLDKMAPKIKKQLKEVQTISNEINEFIGSIQESDIDISDSEEIEGRMNENIDAMLGTIDVTLEALNKLQDQAEEGSPDSEQITTAIDSLNTIKGNLKDLKKDTGKIGDFVAGQGESLTTILNKIKDLSKNVNTDIDAFIVKYDEEIEPTVRAQITDAKKTLQNARGILVEVQDTIPEVKKILNRTSENLADGEDMLDYILGQYPYVNEKVKQLANKIRDIQGETNLADIIELLKNDPDAEKGFFEEPVLLHENQLFPIPNYGTGMTPFYTVLAIWVGALLLISLLSVDVHTEEDVPVRHIYFGRLFTFGLIALLQTSLVSIGDLLIVGVPVAHPVWFVVFSLFTSMIFLLIVYTLVSLFGDVGKASAIVLLVLQIAGSGGTYPVVLLPEFFQMINPLLPFTYAVDLLREAVGGIVQARVIHDVTYLAIFGMIFLLIGTFLKEPTDKGRVALEKKAKKSGLFH